MRHIGNLLSGHSIILLFVVIISGCEKDTTPPGEVTNLTARGEVEQVTLSWTEPPDADLASIQITEVGADKIYAQPAGYDGITILGLTNGTTYEFAVVAVDEAGNKSNAVYASATPSTPFFVADPDQNDYEADIYVNHSNGYQTITPSATFTVDTGGYVHITVSFNKPLDESSVISENTIYFEGREVSAGDLSFSEDKLSLTFTSAETFKAFGSSSTSASYMAYMFDLVLIGEDAGEGFIQDSNGMPLDGDNDGMAGGDYVLELNVYEQIN